jgi:hypothetical protein
MFLKHCVILLSLVCSRFMCMYVCFSRFVVLCWYFGPFAFVICVWMCHFLPPVFWLQVFMYVCVQVCCSVVCNLVLLWYVCGCFVIWSVQVFSFFWSIIFVFWSWDIRRWIKSINTIQLIIIFEVFTKMKIQVVVHNWNLHCHENLKFLPSGCFPSSFPTRILFSFLVSPILATCLAHYSLLAFTVLTILGDPYNPWGISLCNILNWQFTSTFLSPTNSLRTLFWNAL